MESESPTLAPSDRPVSLRAAALGLFVAWQLVYLPASNLLQFLPRSRVPDRGDYVVETQRDGTFTPVRPLQIAYDTFGHVEDRWAEVTGQTQSWQMFCPSLPPQSISPFVILEFANGKTVDIETRFPPAPFRLPLPGFRVQHLEANVIAGLWHFTPASSAADPGAWRDGLRMWAEARPGSIAGYLRNVAVSHSHSATQAALFVRCRSKPADGSIPTVTDLPFVRLNLSDGLLDVWDPLRNDFVRVKNGVSP